MYESIAAAAAALEAGTTSAATLVEDSLQAVHENGGRTNAFTLIDAAGARAAAEAVDRERGAGVRRGPLHGIPISLKDLVDAAGVVTTAASRVLNDRVATRDATVVTRLREAGAILIGRTNLHEFAFGTTSESSAFGPVRHPLDATRSAGGSSGGSAVAVACGMGLASIGTDTGGSIRIPAAVCGVVGLKPTAGEIPTDGVIPLSPTLDHVGPITRTVQDAAWVYAILAGQTPARVAERPTRGLRLRRLAGYFAAPYEPDVGRAWERAVTCLKQAGAEIREGEVSSAGRIGKVYADLVLPEAAVCHAPYLDSRAEGYTEAVRSRLLLGRTVAAVDYLAAREAVAGLRAEVDALLEGVDALVLPTLPIVAPPLGADTITIDPKAGDTPVRAAMLKHTQLFNLTGHPAISIPVPAPGLPVGVQLVGRAAMTSALLEVAAACERIVAGPWQ